MGWIISKTLMDAYENSRCSPEQAVESLAANFSDGEQSAPSSGSHTPQVYLSPDKTTAFSRLSRCGMTCRHFEESIGEDLLTWYRGGFPCQDISSAGRGDGIDGERSSMWKHMARIICEVRPRYAFVENSPMLTTRGLGVVLADMAAMGYDARWGCVSAASCGANHERDRIWIVASDANLSQREGMGVSSGVHAKDTYASNPRWWKDTSELHRVDDGVALRLDRLKAVGNGQSPLAAARAFELLSDGL